MEQKLVHKIVFEAINDFCDTYDIKVNLDLDTPLLGSASILDSMGLVSVIVDIETALLDEEIDISLTSEAAMSTRLSPFRTIKSLILFIDNQINNNV